MKQYLQETPMLDFSDESIQRLVARKGWGGLTDFEKVKGFCGYGVAVRDFQRPPVDFDRNNTYIQSEGITSDFGVYVSIAGKPEPLRFVRA